MPGSFNESQHPRDDHGRFVSAGEMQEAASNPQKLEELRGRVTDPKQRQKLEQAVGEKGSPQGGGEAEADPKAPRWGVEGGARIPKNDNEAVANYHEDVQLDMQQTHFDSERDGIDGRYVKWKNVPGGDRFHEYVMGVANPKNTHPDAAGMIGTVGIYKRHVRYAGQGGQPAGKEGSWVWHAFGIPTSPATAGAGRGGKGRYADALQPETMPHHRLGDQMSRSAGINTAWGFRATQNDDGSLTVHDVPVFVTCERGEHKFNEEWLDEALTRAKQAESDGYLPPMHVRHHGRDSVQPAGVFRATGKRSVRFKGGMRPAIMADLIITSPEIIGEVLAKRLPYRSVEIFDVSKPNLDSLALLDHEAPFLELPMLVVNEVNKGGEGPQVAPATFSMDRGAGDDGLVCFFRRGQRAHVLMEANATMPDEIKDEPKSESKSEPKGDSPKKSKKSNPGAIDVEAVVAAISDGSISIADFAAIKEAMSAAESMAPGTEAPEAPEAPEMPEMTGAAPASAPATAMRRGVDPLEFARVKATADAAQAEIAALKAERKRDVEVAAACESLKDRALGADLSSRLMKFHRDHGSKAFAAYVDGLASSAPRITPGDDRKSGDFSSTRGAIPALAMKFQKDGPEAVEKAAKFAREWEALNAAGHTRMSQERYIEINMAGGPTAIVK